MSAHTASKASGGPSRTLERLRRAMPALVAMATLLVGGFFLARTAPGDTPDVWSHTYRVSSILNGDLTARPVTSKSHLHDSSGNVGGSVDRMWLDYSTEHDDGYDPSAAIADTVADRAGPTVDLPFNNTAVNSPVVYLPQILAFLAGRTLGLSANATYRLAQVVMLGVYAGCMALAIALLPRWRIAMSLVLLDPLMLRYGSFAVSADSFTQAVAIVFTCMMFRAMCRTVSLRYSVILSLVAVVLAMCKFIYAPLALLMLLIPFAQRTMEGRGGHDPGFRRLLAAFSLADIAAFGWLSVWLRLNDWYAVTPMLVPFADIERKKEYLLSHPQGAVDFFKAFGTAVVTGQSNLNNHHDSVKILAFWILAAALLGVILAAGVTGAAPRRQLAMWWCWYLMAVGIVAVNYLALWLQYTPEGAAGIDGMQSRYLLPLAALFALVGFESVNRLLGGKLRRPRQLRIHC
ncbi:MAG: DUF2142 domain-containing protein [Bifidobacterium sp.]|nr:DUF2142 domain-containing protein [Bifidobacterium sp.]